MNDVTTKCSECGRPWNDFECRAHFIKERDRARTFAAHWKALAKRLYVDINKTFEDMSEAVRLTEADRDRLRAELEEVQTREWFCEGCRYVQRYRSPGTPALPPCPSCGHSAFMPLTVYTEKSLRAELEAAKAERDAHERALADMSRLATRRSVEVGNLRHTLERIVDSGAGTFREIARAALKEPAHGR